MEHKQNEFLDKGGCLGYNFMYIYDDTRDYRMNKMLKKIGMIALIIIIAWAVLVIITFAKKVSQNHLYKSKIKSGMEIEKIEYNKEVWQKTMSDIEALSIWDKYEMGLDVRENSDTDGDGLTDKQEIEVYGSNPLQASTANDLYTDSYKVENGMNIMKYYEYEGEIQFLYNECPEVYLEASSPYDFHAVVTKSEQETTFNRCHTYAKYEIYNYSGKISIDVSELLKDNEITPADIEVYMTDGDEVRKCVYETDSQVIFIKNELSELSTYQIFITERNVRSSLSVAFLNDFEERIIKESTQDVTGAGLVVSFPLWNTIFKRSSRIYYEELDSEENSNILREKIVRFYRDYYHDEEESKLENFVYPKSEKRIKTKYNILKTLFPLCDGSNTEFEKYWFFRIFFLYFSYGERMEFEFAGEDVSEKSTSGFYISEDALPFENFKSDIAEMGNGAGISHLTAHVFNSEGYDSQGSYMQHNVEINWDLRIDQENETLINEDLFDYKTKDFVKENRKRGNRLGKGLTDGEQEFLKMLGAASLEGNDYMNSINQLYYGGKNSFVELDYSLVEEMENYLENGKILDVYMKMMNGKVHAVNIYGYEKDPLDENITWFMVYDSNFPGNRSETIGNSEDGFRVKIVRKKKLRGEGYSFSYEYFPLLDSSYGAVSNRDVIEQPLLIVMDEEHRMLHPLF